MVAPLNSLPCNRTFFKIHPSSTEIGSGLIARRDRSRSGREKSKARSVYGNENYGLFLPRINKYKQKNWVEEDEEDEEDEEEEKGNNKNSIPELSSVILEPSVARGGHAKGAFLSTGITRPQRRGHDRPPNLVSVFSGREAPRAES